MRKRIYAGCIFIAMAMMMTACGQGNANEGTTKEATTAESVAGTEEVTVAEEVTTEGQADGSVTAASQITVEGGKETVISEAGSYTVQGNAEDAVLTVDVGDDDDVTLVLSGLTVTNTVKPVIYVKNADEVTIVSEGENVFATTGTFEADGDENTDAVIYSKDDITLAGTGSLTITSTDRGISSNDSLLVESGTYEITAASDALRANEDLTIEDGTLTLTAEECIEATVITVNGGTISIAATDDGINASAKSDELSPSFTLNGGEVTIEMGAGDTDGVDSNGDIYIKGGTISVNGQSAFDYDGKAEFTGGTIIQNGQEVDTITNQFGGGPGGAGPGAFGGEDFGGEGFGGMQPGGGRMPRGDMQFDPNAENPQ